MVFIINIINKEITDAAILGNKQCSIWVGLDVQVGYDRVSNAMVAWSVMDFIIKFLNKEIADAAIFGTKQCLNRWDGLDVQVGYDGVSNPIVAQSCSLGL